MRCVIGIDPGASGGMVLIDYDGTIIDRMKFNGATDHDIAETLREWKDMDRDYVGGLIEHVHSMPKQGVASSFKFGRSFGFLEGLLTALRIPFGYVTPAKWQGEMKCRTKGDKNITKSAAQRLWPDLKWTHALSDAALIAEYGRRNKQ